MTVRRTTLAAEADDLAVLEREARRRGVSLASLPRETVAEKAGELRRSRPKPRFGVMRSGGVGLSRMAVDDEESPAATPFRS